METGIMIGSIICWVMMGIGALGLFLYMLAIVKNEVTFHHHMVISDAIYKYHKRLIRENRYLDSEVEYNDMEDYNSTFKRWWDWGYKRILPLDKFEIIKPYIIR